jgi:hypothetical protein
VDGGSSGPSWPSRYPCEHVRVGHARDRNRSHINTRLPVLADYGLLEGGAGAEKRALRDHAEGVVAATSRST